MVTWLSNDEGEVTPDVLARYVRYARGGAGMIVLEAMGVRDVNSGPLLRIGHDRAVPRGGVAGVERRISPAPRAGAGLREKGPRAPQARASLRTQP